MTAMETDGAADLADGEVPRRRKKLAGKKLVLFIILPLLLIGGVAGALLFTGLLGGSDESHAEATPDGEGAKPEGKGSAEAPAEAAPKGDGKPVFMEIPEILVNLNASGRQPVFLKLKVSLELGNTEDQAPLTEVMPRIQDSFQVYLRELRVEDLRGSAGSHRLREELLMRVNTAAHPVRIRDVLIQEMIMR